MGGGGDKERLGFRWLCQRVRILEVFRSIRRVIEYRKTLEGRAIAVTKTLAKLKHSND
jgi:hypothetical protein